MQAGRVLKRTCKPAPQNQLSWPMRPSCKFFVDKHCRRCKVQRTEPTTRITHYNLDTSFFFPTRTTSPNLTAAAAAVDTHARPPPWTPTSGCRHHPCHGGLDAHARLSSLSTPRPPSSKLGGPPSRAIYEIEIWESLPPCRTSRASPGMHTTAVTLLLAPPLSTSRKDWEGIRRFVSLSCASSDAHQ